jgi:hypothetical protein
LNFRDAKPAASVEEAAEKAGIVRKPKAKDPSGLKPVDDIEFIGPAEAGPLQDRRAI